MDEVLQNMDGAKLCLMSASAKEGGKLRRGRGRKREGAVPASVHAMPVCATPPSASPGDMNEVNE